MLARGGREGFTLIELVLVIGLTALLLFLMLPAYQNFSANQAAYSAAQVLVSHLQKQKGEAAQLEQNAGISIVSVTSYSLVRYPGIVETVVSTQNLGSLRARLSLSPPQSLPYVLAFTPGGTLADPLNPTNPAASADPVTLAIPELTSGNVTYQVLIYRDPQNVNQASKTIAIRRRP